MDAKAGVLMGGVVVVVAVVVVAAVCFPLILSSYLLL